MEKLKASIRKLVDPIIRAHKAIILIVLTIAIAIVGLTATKTDDEHLLPLLEDAREYVETVEVSPTVVVE